MDAQTPPTPRNTIGGNFRRFFVRGLGIILPTVLTIWLLSAAYGFVQVRIAQPINAGVRELVVTLTPWPTVLEEDLVEHEQVVMLDPERRREYRESGSSREWLRRDARRHALERWWRYNHYALDLIGLVLAIVAIYAAGLALTSYIGHRLYRRGERIVQRVPLIGRVYPSVKQITDFFVGGDGAERMKFNRVVALEYPRKGAWSVGMVTGETMRAIVDRAGTECLTVFVPSSPTPFTGYVVVVPKSDTIELPITVEDAVKFAVSGGVLIPPSQRLPGSPGEGSASGDAAGGPVRP